MIPQLNTWIDWQKGGDDSKRRERNSFIFYTPPYRHRQNHWHWVQNEMVNFLKLNCF